MSRRKTHELAVSSVISILKVEFKNVKPFVLGSGNLLIHHNSYLVSDTIINYLGQLEYEKSDRRRSYESGLIVSA